MRPHFASVKAARIRDFGISPTGVRAVFEAWGEIMTVPTDKGDIRNLTRSPAVADRDPALDERLHLRNAEIRRQPGRPTFRAKDGSGQSAE